MGAEMLLVFLLVFSLVVLAAAVGVASRKRRAMPNTRMGQERRPEGILTAMMKLPRLLAAGKNHVQKTRVFYRVLYLFEFCNIHSHPISSSP